MSILQQFKQLGEQLLAIWKQLGINQRIIVVTTGIGIFAGVLGIAYWSGQTQYSLLYGDLSLKEIDNIRTQLDTQSIPHKVGPTGNSILVPTEQVHNARIYLAGKGLPNNSEKIGLEIFDRASFGLSNMQQRVNHTRAIQGELAKMIADMDGIDDASVMVVMPESKLFTDSQSQASASVFIKTSGNIMIGKEQVRSIQSTVAHGVEGLVPDRVSVTNSKGELLSEEPESDTGGFMSDRELEGRRHLEAYLAHKAEDMLKVVLGPGNAIVRVSAEINRDTITLSEKVYDSESVPLSTNETTETTKTETALGGTALVNGGLNNTNATVTPPEMKTTERTTKDNEFAVGEKTRDIVETPGGIKFLSAAVFVAKKKETVDGQVTYTDRDPQELQSIERIVSRALGITNTVEQLTVEQFVFHENDHTVQLEQFQKQIRYNEWFRIGKQVGYLGLTLGVLWAFARTFHKTPIDTIPLGVPLDEIGDFAEAEDGNGNGNGPIKRRKRSFSIHEPGPPDERIELMNRLIKNHPQNMTHAIQSWLQEENGKSN